MLATSDVKEVESLNKETKHEIKKLVGDLDSPLMELQRITRRFKNLSWELEPFANILQESTKNIQQLQEVIDKACSKV